MTQPSHLRHLHSRTSSSATTTLLPSVLLLLLLVTTLFIHTIQASSVIEQVFIISRHCDRTPISDVELPMDPINWTSKLGLAQGQLTGLGIAQCFTMGQHLRSRYLLPESENQISGITFTKFDSEQFKFTSTSVDRTIISLNAVSQGLFPNGTGLNNDLSKQPSLNGDISLVPVHTIPEHEDILLRGFERCPTIDDRLSNLYVSKDFLQLQKEQDPMMQLVANVTGVKIGDFRDYYWVYDVLMVQKSHNLLNLSELTNQETWSKIQKLGNLVNYQKFTRKIQQNLGAGPLVQRVLDSFEMLIAKEKSPKYIHMSAHDSTLESIFATLDIDGAHEELQGVPPYGSQVIFELHRDTETNKYSVQVVIRLGYNADFVAYPLGGKCPNASCAWSQFKSQMNSKSSLTVKAWCDRCGNDFTSYCTQHLLNKKRSENTVLLISLPITIGVCAIFMAVLSVLFLRHRKNYYAALP